MGLAIEQILIQYFGEKKAEAYFLEALKQYKVSYETKSRMEVLCEFGFKYGQDHKIKIGDDIQGIVKKMHFEAKIEPNKEGKRNNLSTQTTIAEVAEQEGSKKKVQLVREEIDIAMSEEESQGDWNFDELNVSH